MAISFNTIPNDVRVPLFYAEMNNSKAGTFTASYRSLIIGQTQDASSEEVNKPVYISSAAQAQSKFGASSQLAQMVEAYLDNNSSVEIYAVPIADPTSGAAATGSVTVSGSATAAGTLSLYVYDQIVSVGVDESDSASDVASAIVAAITADSFLPVSASASSAVVTLTAKHKGTIGNDIKLYLNLGGDTNGEETPSGLTITLNTMSGGSGNVDLSTAISNLGEEQYDFVITGATDATTLGKLSDYMNDKTGNWSYTKQLYGHIWGAYRGTCSELQTFGGSYNDQHMSILGVYGTPSPIWKWAAGVAGSAATSIASDPARPLQTLTIEGVTAPEQEDRFILSERETLLKNGISTFNVNSGTAQIERIITTYQTNAYGVADNSYLSVETMYTSAYIMRYLKSIITSKYGRHKLAGDDARFGEGQAIVTPKIIRAELITAYQKLENLGLVEDADAFKENLIVERNANDNNRMDVLFTPDYVNQLNVFALVNQFRL